MAEIFTFPNANNTPSKVNTYPLHSTNHAESASKHKEATNQLNNDHVSASAAVLAQSILENSHQLHAQGAIDTASFNKCIHMFSALASGITYTEPEPPIAS